MRAKILEKHPDERGFFAEIVREDWKEFFEDKMIVQLNLAKSYPGIIKAWHRHVRGQIDYVIVLQGSFKIVAYDDNEGSETIGQLQEIISSDEVLQVVRIPGHYWHGFKAIGDKPTLFVYGVSNLYDYRNPDEGRRPWDDPSIIDPRTKKPFDWNSPPHK
ncbi:MAG: dTDP-4-dehydrorhamnose 3,5-epimerase family protein [Thaumarchaeota archaeon]|nr:dTDP-4-dehydrorhamnose 3,5-epimerase family protein [Nitrososphaerota archaeon]MCL5318573.1 dTDP-4-dehydrorhamnose 3,5-epimerase family protein [Nitrososphaerota archaeon]